jgi:hypothetical protein
VDGTHPAAEGGGDLGVGKVVDVAERERHSLSCRQSREGSDQRLPYREPGVDVAVWDRSTEAFLIQERERRLDFPRASPLLQPAHGVTHGYPMHPGIEGFGVAELSERAQDVYGNLLGNVCGVFPTSHQGRRGAQGHAKRTACQRLGRVAIARAKAPHLVGDEFSYFPWLGVHLML